MSLFPWLSSPIFSQLFSYLCSRLPVSTSRRDLEIMGILASKGIEYEDSYRSFSEKERQHLLSLFNQLATANDLGVMKVEFEPLKVRPYHRGIAVFNLICNFK